MTIRTSKKNVRAVAVMKALRHIMKDSSDYAHLWHSNLAMAYMVETDSGDHSEQVRISNQAASRFMKLAFNVETKK